MRAESQQLPGQAFRTFAAFADLLQHIPQGVFRKEALERQGPVSIDDGQEVIEVVGDAAGKTADRLQFLSLDQLGRQLLFFRLGQLALGDVRDDAVPEGTAVPASVRDGPGPSANEVPAAAR